ncbi:MAG: AI-2E family transporter [Microcoleaceae cyanobacterium]
MKSINKLWQSWMWGLLFPLIILNCWILLLVFEYFRSLITVFILATLLSFVLDYPVRLLRRYGMKRNSAIFLVSALTLLVLLIITLTVVPLIFQQLNELATGLPTWIKSGIAQIETFHQWAESRNLPINVSGLTSQLSDRISTQLQGLMGQILSFVLGAAGSVADLLLTLLLTFYLLLHGEHLWDDFFGLLPLNISRKFRESLKRNFHNYYIGQATLAMLMGASLIVAYLILRVPFGLLFGLIIGLMTLIPFGALASIWTVGLLMILNNFGFGLTILIVSLIVDQIIESGIAPRLLGGFTGLNPVWIIMSLLVAAKIGGLLGLLVAVPLASVIKNMIDIFVASPRGFDSAQQNGDLN